jgi:hypothetical protein
MTENFTYYGRPWSGFLCKTVLDSAKGMAGMNENSIQKVSTDATAVNTEEVRRLLNNPVAIAKFGTELAAVPALPEYDQITVTQFMEKLNTFLQILSDSHPHKTMQKHSLIDKFFGYDLVSDSRYIVAVRKRNKALQDLLSSVAGLTQTYDAIKASREGLTERKEALKNSLEQTRHALDIITNNQESVKTDNMESIERLSKRLVDLAAVVMVMEIHERQCGMIDTQLLSALDLFYRLQDKFLPILDQHEKAIKENPKSSKKMYKEFSQYVAVFSKTNNNLIH